MDPLGLCSAKKPYAYYAGVGGFAGIAELIATVTAPAFEFITGVVTGIVSGISVAVVAVEAAVVAAIVLVFSTNTQRDEVYLEKYYDDTTYIPPTTIARDKYKTPPNPNQRKGAEERQKTGAREKNVKPLNGEEHSRIPKGGFRKR